VSIRTLHLLGSPVLRERAVEVRAVNPEVAALVQDLFDTMRAAQGIGLAANQVGVLQRVAVVDTGDGEPVALIDPIIVERYGEDRAEEGCLSIPDIYGEVDRATRVVVEITTPDGARAQVAAVDLKARAIQHEIDHLDGILFLDRLSPLKRRMLLRKWQKLRKGETAYLKELPPTPVPE
jgi:peptide deformylase